MITKTQLISTLDNLPENLTIDQVIDHIIFIDKVKKGMADSASGRVNTKEKARLKLNKMLR